jgi:hypothetical protein
MKSRRRSCSSNLRMHKKRLKQVMQHSTSLAAFYPTFLLLLLLLLKRMKMKAQQQQQQQQQQRKGLASSQAVP